ncbi:hypothetical protein LCGC14_1354680 [marine sediment metagenome]|uniref:Uncharacterized protein n=1 Tax=marine sediment metagenome TaxID=412755 RepID=A0A0F9K9U4_9ZZZZ
MNDIDYQAWATDLCGLLDERERTSDDEDAVRALCNHRFSIARMHGLTIEFLGLGEVGTA